MRIRSVVRLCLALLTAAAASAGPPPDDSAPVAKPGPDGERCSPERPFHHFEQFIPRQARLGVELEDMTPELREFLHAPKEHGVLVVRVNESSPAAKAGLRVGDVIVGVAGNPVDETAAFIHAVLGAEKDAKLALDVVRDGKKRSLEAKLEGEPLVAGPAMPWMGGRMLELRQGLEQRMHELEERVRRLEQDLHKPPPAGDDLDT